MGVLSDKPSAVRNRRYRAAHPERQRAWNLGAGERSRQYRAANPDARRVENLAPDKVEELRAYGRAQARRQRVAHADDPVYRERKRASNRADHQNHPLRRSANNRRQKSGYHAETYDRMCAEQNGLCALCGHANASGKALHADHCHVTGIIRRPLCERCNFGLGAALDQPWILEMAGPKILRFFRHDRELINRAIDYIYNFRMAAAVPILCGVPKWAG